MRPLTFAGGAIDRASHLRARAESLRAETAARVLPLWRGKPLLEDGPRLVWLRADDPLLHGAAEPAVFLGMATDGPRFALDLSHLEGPASEGAGFLDKAVLELSSTRRFAELRGVMADLTQDEAGDAAAAKGVLDWHRTHPRCARCGAPTAQEDGGWRRGCAECDAKHFPRTDPVVIMLVLRGDRVLLGRQAAWPERMYSLLAGFMEPGETIEEAVRRETFEETRVRVGPVGYVCSQPWPFPASLMIGCAARATTEAITPDPTEIDDALWADKAEVAASLEGASARFTAARRGAVARALLEAWVAGEIDAPAA